MKGRRCVVCGDRIRFWQEHAVISNYSPTSFVHARRKYAGTNRTCVIMWTLVQEIGLSDQFLPKGAKRK